MDIPNNGQGDEVDPARPPLSNYRPTSSASAGPPPPITTTERYADLEDYEFEYKMRHRSRGVAVIINNEKFSPETGMNARSGSSVDRDSLKEVLTFVGFRDIRVHNNLTVKQMHILMDQIGQIDFTDMDCLFMAVLSHGEEGIIYGVDGAVEIEQLMAPLKDSNAATLIGKPKIFLLQACRGEKLDEGREISVESGEIRVDALATKRYIISKESDFLLAYSVVPGYYSWRNSSNGSWFVQAFCEVMMRDGRRLDLVKILTRVNRMVSYTFKSNASAFHMTNKKQSPCIVSMLTKDLYFS